MATATYLPIKLTIKDHAFTCLNLFYYDYYLFLFVHQSKKLEVGCLKKSEPKRKSHDEKENQNDGSSTNVE